MIEYRLMGNGEKVVDGCLAITDKGTLEPANAIGHIIQDGDCGYLAPYNITPNHGDCAGCTHSIWRGLFTRPCEKCVRAAKDYYEEIVAPGEDKE